MEAKIMSGKKGEDSGQFFEKTGGRFNKAAIYFRWFFVAFVLPVFLHVSQDAVSPILFFETLALAVVYNIAVTIYLVRHNGENKGTISLLGFADAVFVSVFSYQLGGIDSDIYVVLLFIIGYCGIYGDKSSAIKVSTFSIITYTLSTVYASAGLSSGISYWRLVLRDLFILFAAVGISFIIGEAKKYNEMHKREFKLARTDKLTGLANRHYLDQKLAEEVDYADFSGEPLNVLIFDLDNFKKFNDTYGHVWGDKLLTLFSDIVKQNIRRYDIPVRYGGEEFLILIRGLSIDMAKSVGDRIRRQLEKQRIYIGNGENRKRVTVSCGVAQYPKHSPDIKEVIELADKALYHAKEIGKNIVVNYDEIGNVQNNVQVDIDMYMER